MLLEHIAHHEPVQRHPPRDEFAYGRFSTLQSQVARVETRWLNRHIGLGHKILVTCEDLQRSCLSRRVTIESEDHLTMERVMIAHQPAQQPSMIITKGSTARGDCRVDAGQMSRH